MSSVYDQSFDFSYHIALDCEFVGVNSGGYESALARVSIVDFNGHIILDTFCCPELPIIDYRTNVSGVRPENLIHAPSFFEVRDRVAAILSGRVLVGHAIQNDLEVLMLPHPGFAIRDTQLYPPFQNAAKRPTPSLKLLAKIVLNEDIQMAEHDSVVDAQITMKLFRQCAVFWEASLAQMMKDHTRSQLLQDRRRSSPPIHQQSSPYSVMPTQNVFSPFAPGNSHLSPSPAFFPPSPSHSPSPIFSIHQPLPASTYFPPHHLRNNSWTSSMASSSAPSSPLPSYRPLLHPGSSPIPHSPFSSSSSFGGDFHPERRVGSPFPALQSSPLSRAMPLYNSEISPASSDESCHLPLPAVSDPVRQTLMNMKPETMVTPIRSKHQKSFSVDSTSSIRSNWSRSSSSSPLSSSLSSNDELSPEVLSDGPALKIRRKRRRRGPRKGQQERSATLPLPGSI